MGETEIPIGRKVAQSLTRTGGSIAEIDVETQASNEFDLREND